MRWQRTVLRDTYALGITSWKFMTSMHKEALKHVQLYCMHHAPPAPAAPIGETDVRRHARLKLKVLTATVPRRAGLRALTWTTEASLA